MTSLDQLVIEHIERSSRVTLPQEDRTLILDIVSRHEFDEDAARQFAEFYVNVNYRYGLSKELSEIFNKALIKFSVRGSDLASIIQSRPLWAIARRADIGELEFAYTSESFPNFFYKKDGLNNYLLIRAIKLLNITARSLKNYSQIDYSDGKDDIVKDLIKIINEKGNDFLALQLRFVKEPKSKEIIYAYIDLLEKLIVINANTLMPLREGIGRSIMRDDLHKLMDHREFSEFPDGVARLDLMNKFLDMLSKYRCFKEGQDFKKVQKFDGRFDYLLMWALCERELSMLRCGVEFLSRHDPEKEYLYQVLPRLVDILEIKIPDYEVIDFLGEGAYKRTYLARDVNLDHYVAIKIIDVSTLAQQNNIQRLINAKFGRGFNDLTKQVLAKMNEDIDKLSQEKLNIINQVEDQLLEIDWRVIEKDLIKIFQEEARLMLRATSARSQNLPQIYKAYYDMKKHQYIIVEELGDHTLQYILEKQGAMKAPVVYQWMRQIVNGLEELHLIGFVHGDLKPENILVNGDNTVRITDFGWSSQIPLLSEHYDDPRYLTNLLTCAPEVFDGKHPDEKSDIWSAGVIAYRMITGEWPFQHGFTGTPEEWKALSLEKKQEYAMKIRSQMTEEKIASINCRMSMKELEARLHARDFVMYSCVNRFINTSLELSPEKRRLIFPIAISSGSND